MGRVSPNPMVGAVITKQGRILAQGYHRCYGEPHAEVNALSLLGSGEGKGATLYVTLEPCAHHGKTPPCTHAILDYGISRIVVGMEDPNPCVHGKGIKELRRAGVRVDTGVLEGACRALNAPYIKAIQKGKPFVTVKVAQTLDGKIATQTGHSRWITTDASRRKVHRLRKSHDAVLVGVNTVIADDPQLTVRHVRGNHPKRIILDSNLRVPESACVLTCCDPHLTVLATTETSSQRKRDALIASGHEVWVLPQKDEGGIHLDALWKKMVKEGILSVLVEGGRNVFTSVVLSGETDHYIAFIAPKLFGKGIDTLGELNVSAPEEALRFSRTIWKRAGADAIFEGWF